MRRTQGYAVISGPGGVVERDTITCAHCQHVVTVKPGTALTVYLLTDRQGMTREEPGAFCRVCMAPICLRCHDRGGCTPWEQTMERMEARERLWRSVGL